MLVESDDPEAFIPIKDSTEKSPVAEAPKLEETIGPQATKLEKFAKTARAAKLSGAFHETAGMVKRKVGKFTENTSLEDAGRNEELLGKIHRFVGTLRGVHEATSARLFRTRTEGLAVCQKHGGRMLDVATDFIEDMKNVLLK